MVCGSRRDSDASGEARAQDAAGSKAPGEYDIYYRG